jgi:hypothetical protein
MKHAQRVWVSAILALVLVSAGLLATPQAALAIDGNPNCGQTWPTSGSLQSYDDPDSNYYSVTFQFTLTSAQRSALQCAGSYLELDFRIRNFDVPAAWEGYSVSGTNLPGALHDVAFMDVQYEANPAVTRIYTNQLIAGKSYYVTLSWGASVLPGMVPYIFFVWTPSHWSRWNDLVEAGSCANGGNNVLAEGNGSNANEAWCVFPYENITVTLFGNRTFAGGFPNGFLPLTGLRWYDWYPTGDVAGSSVAPLPPAPSPAPPALPNRQMFLRGDSAVFAKDTFGNNGWTQETDPGSAQAIAAGGATQMLIDACSAVYARNTLGMAGWTKETDCGTAKAIAVSSTGVQMLINACDAVYAKSGIGLYGWTQETGCGSVKAIATGGSTQMLIDACDAVHAKNTIGDGGWVQETACGTAKAIAVSATGVQMIINACDSVWAKNSIGYGGWSQETDCGNATKIAVGGNTQLIMNACNAVWAKTSIGYGGWSQESDCGATAIAVNGQGRQVVRTSDLAIYAKDTIGMGGWSIQVGPWNAAAIAIG